MANSAPSTVVFNYTINDIIKRVVLGYTTEETSDGYDNIIKVYEIVELTIKHPTAPESAFLVTIAKELYMQYKASNKTDPVAIAAKMHYLSQSNLTNVINLKGK